MGIREPDPVQDAMHTIPFNLPKNPEKGDKERETEAQRGKDTPPRSHCTEVVWPGFRLKSVHSKSLGEGGLGVFTQLLFSLFLL